MLKLRERNYHSRFDRRHTQPQRRVTPEYQRKDIDIRGNLWKWGPWVGLAAIGWWAVDYFFI